MSRLRVTEIFLSLQGETKTVGIPTVFIRLTGCPLRCQYCDTAYAFYGGQLFTLSQILSEVAAYQVRYVTVTGGEPLAQKKCLDLLTALCDVGYEVSLETNGVLDMAAIDKRVIKIMDIKTPASQEAHQNCYENVEFLSSRDQVKFVICDRNDYEWSKQITLQHRLMDRCEVLFSPSHGQMDNQMLADWILQDRFPVRFQLQMHKYIWGDVPGR